MALSIKSTGNTIIARFRLRQGGNKQSGRILARNAKEYAKAQTSESP